MKLSKKQEAYVMEKIRELFLDQENQPAFILETGIDVEINDMTLSLRLKRTDSDD